MSRIFEGDCGHSKLVFRPTRPEHPGSLLLKDLEPDMVVCRHNTSGSYDKVRILSINEEAGTWNVEFVSGSAKGLSYTSSLADFALIPYNTGTGGWNTDNWVEKSLTDTGS